MIIIQTLHWVEFAGTEKLCVDLCNELAKHHRVYLFSSEAIKPYLNDNVQLIPVDFEKNRYNSLFLYQLAKHIQKIQPDIIHCHNAKELEIMVYSRIFQSCKIPIVATKHTLKPKKKYKLADLSVAILEDTQAIIDSPNTRIIKNGMAYTPPQKLPKAHDFHIVSAARLSPPKGMDIVIRAAALLDFDFKLSLYGRGEQEGELRQLIKTLNLEDRIEIAGFVDNLNDHLYSCDVQIIASRFEPYGLTAIDGIYYSKLLLSTKTGICKQILPDELLFDTSPEALATKLNDVYRHYDTYCKAFETVKATKERYSIEHMTKEYEATYRELTGEKI